MKKSKLTTKLSLRESVGLVAILNPPISPFSKGGLKGDCNARTRNVTLLFCILIFGFCFYLGIEAAHSGDKSTSTVNIYADEIVYDHSTETILANENVRVYYKDMELHADKIKYVRNKNIIIAEGNIEFKKEHYSLTSEKLIYNIKFSTGMVYNVSIKSPPMYVYADEVIIKGKDEFLIPSGDITTCSHKPPHYKFKGKKIYLKLNSRFSSYSTLLFIRGLPTFYYPYYTRSLGPKKLETDINIGSSSKNGNFIKTKLLYPFTKGSKSYAGVDLMTKRGVGFKTGHRYQTDKGRSCVDLYYIRDKDGNVDRGRLYAKGWQEIMENISVRYRTEYTSHYHFNYNYDQRVYEYKKKDLYYQLGFQYSKSRYLLDVYGDKKEVWDELDYSVENFILPGVKFQLLPLYTPGKMRFSGNIHYINKYYPVEISTTSKEEWQSSISWESKIDKTYRLNISRPYYIALSPGFGFDGVIRKSLRRYISMFLGMQHGLYRKIFVDGDYLWRRSIEPPYHIKKNIIKYEITYRPSSRFMISSNSSYDFMETVIEPVGDFLNKLKLDYSVYSLFIRNRYDYYKKISKEWLYELDINKISEIRVKYNYRYPDRLELGQRFTLRWHQFKICLGTGFYINKVKGFYRFTEFIEKSMSLNWNMHCWDSEFRIRNFGKETEFWVLFNISAFPQPKAGVYGNLRYDDFRYYRE